MGGVEGLGSALIVIWLIGFVLLIVWIVLPFAVFGTKPLLRQLIQEQRRTNELLELRRSGPRTER